jgi:hypothetical protein
LSGARHEAPRPKVLSRTLLAVTSAAGLLSGHTTAGAAGGTAAVSLVKLAATWTVVSAVVVGGGVAAVEVVPPLVTQPAAVERPAGHGARQPALEARAPVANPQRHEPVFDLRDEVVSAPAGSVGGAGVRGPSARPERLAAEVALLDRARQALVSGNTELTRRLAGEYLARYPGGRLEQEARLLKMNAASEAGESVAARREAEQLLERHPDSPHARAAREVLSAP